MAKFPSLQDYILEEQAKGLKKDGYWIPVDVMNKIIGGILSSFDAEIKNLKDDLLSKKRVYPKRGVFDVLKNWWYNAIYGSRNLKNPYYHRNTLGHLGTFSKNEMTLQQYKMFQEYAEELEQKLLLKEQRYYIEDIIDQWANKFRFELENTLRDVVRALYRPTEPAPAPVKPTQKGEVTPAPISPVPSADTGEEFPDIPEPTETESQPETETDAEATDEIPAEEQPEEGTEEFPDEESDYEAEPESPTGELDADAASDADELPESEPVESPEGDEEEEVAEPTPPPAPAGKSKEDILNEINNIVYSYDILDRSQTKVDKDLMKRRLKNFHVYNLSKPDDDFVMDMIEREFAIKQLFRYYEIQDPKKLPATRLQDRSPQELENILKLLQSYNAHRTSVALNGLITKLLKIMPWPDMAESVFEKMLHVDVRRKAQPSPDFKKMFENTTLYERTLVCLEKLRS